MHKYVSDTSPLIWNGLCWKKAPSLKPQYKRNYYIITLGLGTLNPRSCLDILLTT